jgi:hypothetical protein
MKKLNARHAMLGFIKLASGLIEEKRVSSVQSIIIRFKH